jgi:hypothetical protein
MNATTDMRNVIIPKSDQLNSDDLISGPRTITIREVTIKAGEQPCSMFFDGDNGKPYKPCKSMARVLVSAWGADAKAYVGRSLTLYRDPKVKWAGMEVGGIRISNMSHLDHDMTMALTETKGKRAMFTVKPLAGAPGKPETKTENTPPAIISFTAQDGEIREFPRTLGGMEQYVEAFAAEFGAAVDKAAWFDGNKALFHEMAIGAVGTRGKNARCEKLAARFDAVAAVVEAALADAPVDEAELASDGGGK